MNDNVDIMYTVIIEGEDEKPPPFPLQQAFVTDGIELIHNSKNIGRKAIKSQQTFRHSELLNQIKDIEKRLNETDTIVTFPTLLHGAGDHVRLSSWDRVSGKYSSATMIDEKKAAAAEENLVKQKRALVNQRNSVQRKLERNAKRASGISYETYVEALKAIEGSHTETSYSSDSNETVTRQRIPQADATGLACDPRTRDLQRDEEEEVSRTINESSSGSDCHETELPLKVMHDFESDPDTEKLNEGDERKVSHNNLEHLIVVGVPLLKGQLTSQDAIASISASTSTCGSTSVCTQESCADRGLSLMTGKLTSQDSILSNSASTSRLRDDQSEIYSEIESLSSGLYYGTPMGSECTALLRNETSQATKPCVTIGSSNDEEVVHYLAFDDCGGEDSIMASQIPFRKDSNCSSQDEESSDGCLSFSDEDVFNEIDCKEKDIISQNNVESVSEMNSIPSKNTVPVVSDLNIEDTQSNNNPGRINICLDVDEINESNLKSIGTDELLTKGIEDKGIEIIAEDLSDEEDDRAGENPQDTPASVGNRERKGLTFQSKTNRSDEAQPNSDDNMVERDKSSLECNGDGNSDEFSLSLPIGTPFSYSTTVTSSDYTMQPSVTRDVNFSEFPSVTPAPTATSAEEALLDVSVWNNNVHPSHDADCTNALNNALIFRDFSRKEPCSASDEFSSHRRDVDASNAIKVHATKFTHAPSSSLSSPSSEISYGRGNIPAYEAVSHEVDVGRCPSRYSIMSSKTARGYSSNPMEIEVEAPPNLGTTTQPSTPESDITSHTNNKSTKHVVRKQILREILYVFLVSVLILTAYFFNRNAQLYALELQMNQMNTLIHTLETNQMHISPEEKVSISEVLERIVDSKIENSAEMMKSCNSMQLDVSLPIHSTQETQQQFNKIGNRVSGSSSSYLADFSLVSTVLSKEAYDADTPISTPTTGIVPSLYTMRTKKTIPKVKIPMHDFYLVQSALEP